MSRDRFTFTENFKELADALDDDKRLKFYDAITNYIFKDIEPTDPFIVALFNSMKYLLDRTQFWGGKRTGAGAPRGNNNAKKNNQVNQDSIKIQSNDNQETIKNNQINHLDCFPHNKDNNININNTQELESNIQESNIGVVGGKEKGVSDAFVAELEKQELAKVKSKRFVPPTIEQVKEYCTERKNSVDAERFVSYYDSNGWKVGKNPMKDWKAAVRTWERSGFNTSQKAKSISSPDYVGEGSFLRRAEDDPFCADL